MWRDIFHPRTGRLLFRYDPDRAIIQVQQRGEKVTVDLQEYHRTDIARAGDFEIVPVGSPAPSGWEVNRISK